MASAEQVGRTFLGAAGIDGDAAVLGRQLEDARAAGEAKWGLTVDAEAFARYVAERVEDEVEDLGELHLVDLVLAHACATGDATAVRVFERDYVSTLPAMVSRLAPSEAVIDDMRQVLRDRLLVAEPERPPSITRYAGRGALAGWLKVVAVRETMAQMKRRGPPAVEEEAALLTAPGHDPEFDLMRQRYGEAFKTAFVGALGSLSERDRAVLREHLVERLSIDQIGSLHGVHRATAARWLVSIREGLYEGTRVELSRQLDIDANEYESILRLIRSQLHVTVGKHLT